MLTELNMPPNVEVRPRLSLLFLAAGFSRRMGQNKLLLPWGEGLLMEPALNAMLGLGTILEESSEASLLPCLGAMAAVVSGPGKVADFLEGRLPVVVAHAASQGQAESLKAGMNFLLHVTRPPQGILVVLADMPLISQALLIDLAQGFAQQYKAGQGLCVAPEFNGQRGNPVLLHHSAFAEVLALSGDKGARQILAQRGCHLLTQPDAACIVDMDTPEEYAKWHSRA